MITVPGTIEEYKGIFLDLLLNHTDKVTKVSPDSVLNGISYGVAKLAQKTTKDVALIEARKFPDTAFDQYLDQCALDAGVAPRFGASGSSTYIRVVGDPGTQYIAGTHSFSGNNGMVFNLAENVTISLDGFSYALVNSQATGENSNVDPLTITKVTPVPNGHLYCINENKATGGRDIEDDESLRKRIREGANILARGTISMLTQACITINPNVLRVYYRGRDIVSGKLILEILTQNGSSLSNLDISNLTSKLESVLNLNELRAYNITGESNLLIRNITWQPIDISARVIIENGVNSDDVRKECQINLNKYFDYRYFNKTSVQWTDLYQIIKQTPGIAYISDTNFSPNSDFEIDRDKQPRIRGMLLLDINGGILSNSSNTLNPIYYPNIADFSYQKTLFNTLNL